VSVIYRATYLLTVAVFLFIYYGCASTSSTGRYGNQADDSEEETNNSPRRFSSGDLPDDDQVDISAVMEVYEKRETNSDITSQEETNKEKLLMEIIGFLNTPYQYGGNSKQGIDCSAFTQTVFKNSLSYNLNRSAREQYKRENSTNKVQVSGIWKTYNLVISFFLTLKQMFVLGM
jgi:cell wall-associated NlpC family hydrolase